MRLYFVNLFFNKVDVSCFRLTRKTVDTRPLHRKNFEMVVVLKIQNDFPLCVNQEARIFPNGMFFESGGSLLSLEEEEPCAVIQKRDRFVMRTRIYCSLFLSQHTQTLWADSQQLSSHLCPGTGRAPTWPCLCRAETTIKAGCQRFIYASIFHLSEKPFPNHIVHTRTLTRRNAQNQMTMVILTAAL